ncbi:hypothetical protein F0562_016430 [Nyssa sinensis]|uniref:Uncharacterized protein n=1 Tax=Nyssa sinensis TaxID=561372 RepID=A0A5J4ZNK9_9ASTE|nr:hypothetical protein F0562_016430 [Nyssa sinensis]
MLDLDPEIFYGALGPELPQKQKAPAAAVQIPQALLTWLQAASWPLQLPAAPVSSLIRMSSAGPLPSSGPPGAEQAEIPIQTFCSGASSGVYKNGIGMLSRVKNDKQSIPIPEKDRQVE